MDKEKRGWTQIYFGSRTNKTYIQIFLKKDHKSVNWKWGRGVNASKRGRKDFEDRKNGRSIH